MRTPVGPLLQDLAAEIPEPDLAARTWVAGRRRVARRRRVAAAAVAGAAVVAAVALGAAQLRQTPTAAPVPGHGGTPAAYQPAHVVVDGTTVDLAPDPLQESELPPLPQASDISLPGRLGFAADATLPRLADLGGLAQPVRAVLLRHVDGGASHPVLYVPDRRDGAYVEDDSVTLRPLTDADGYSFAYLGPSTIAEDRHRMAFIQPDAVLVLDARDGSTHSWPVPDRLLSGGWSRDGHSVVVEGVASTWRVDASTGAVTRVSGQAFPGRARLVSSTSGSPVLETARADGARADARPAPDGATGWWGETVTNLEGWSVSGAFLSPPVTATAASYQGLYAVQFDVSAHARVLAAPDTPGVPKGSVEARGWAPQDVVLFTSRTFSDPGTTTTLRLLAWDVIDGRLWRVSELGPVSSLPGGFTGDVALSP